MLGHVVYSLVPAFFSKSFARKKVSDHPLKACSFRYVVRNKISVDGGSLCHFLDRLCGLLSLSIAYQTRGLHNVILPCSWFHELDKFFDNFERRSSRCYELIVDSIPQLLEDLYTGRFTQGMAFPFRFTSR
jgi:hypothetical protein